MRRVITRVIESEKGDSLKPPDSPSVKRFVLWSDKERIAQYEGSRNSYEHPIENRSYKVHSMTGCGLKGQKGSGGLNVNPGAVAN